MDASFDSGQRLHLTSNNKLWMPFFQNQSPKKESNLPDLIDVIKSFEFDATSLIKFDEYYILMYTLTIVFFVFLSFCLFA